MHRYQPMGDWTGSVTTLAYLGRIGTADQRDGPARDSGTRERRMGAARGSATMKEALGGSTRRQYQETARGGSTRRRHDEAGQRSGVELLLLRWSRYVESKVGSQECHSKGCDDDGCIGWTDEDEGRSRSKHR